MFKGTGTSGHATHEQITTEYESPGDTGIIGKQLFVLGHRKTTVFVRGR